MSTQSWVEIIIAVAALIVLSLAATVEALTGLMSRQRLRAAAEDAGGGGRSLQGLLDPRRSLASSLLIVQTVALLIAATAVTTLVRREVGRFDHLLTVVVVTLAYLVFGRALPKAIGTGRPG